MSHFSTLKKTITVERLGVCRCLQSITAGCQVRGAEEVLKDIILVKGETFKRANRREKRGGRQVEIIEKGWKTMVSHTLKWTLIGCHCVWACLA